MKRGDLQSNGLPPDGKPGGASEPRPSNGLDAGSELGLDAAAELEIIDAAFEGDTKAFADLLERYRPDLHGYCLRRLNDASLAEDVVQEIFIRAFTNLSNFDRSKRIWPWLATIAFRLCTDVQRERSRTFYSADIGITLDIEAKGRTGSSLDSIIASEDRAQLLKALKALPKRQRRVLELYALEGLSYENIAAAEGISVGAVKLLLVRARKEIRSAGRNRTFGVVAFPFTWLSWKLQRIEEKLRPLLGAYGEGLSSVCAQGLCLGALTMVVVATSNPVWSIDAGRSIETATASTILSSTQPKPPVTALPHIVAPAKVPSDSQQPATESWIEDLIEPSSATPENTLIGSIAVSPNYENDHTILASGYHQPASVLFVSRDGGANWKTAPSHFLFGYANLVLPPRFPHDSRIFAFGDLGLQQSNDGGEIFKTVSSVLSARSIAISPSFGRGDSKILIGGETLFEYDADTGLTQPAPPILSPVRERYFSIALSPSYPSDPTVFISNDGSDLYRCKDWVCIALKFPFGPVRLRLSPHFEQDGLAYALTAKKLFVSNDGSRTFREISLPKPDRDWIGDIAILWNATSDAPIYVSTTSTNPTAGVYRSFDAGRSWNKSRIDVPGFESGATKLIVTPNGRLLAAGAHGIACSVDAGQTWALRCSPE